MLLTITTTHQPATDLGFLLSKHPDRVQSFDLNFGTAWVFYPEAGPERCTAALLFNVDPIGLVRGRRGAQAGSDHYVNDRPYVASSFFSVAIAEVFSSALAGRAKDRAELAEQAIPLEAAVSVVPCRGGEALLRKLFEPLGYQVECERLPLDEQFPEWGEGPYYSLRLAQHCRLRDLLAHLYVLIPVLDDDKHYWVGDDEVAKLLRAGEGWLASHPERTLISRRYLKHQAKLARTALEQLVPEAAAAETGELEDEAAAPAVAATGAEGAAAGAANDEVGDAMTAAEAPLERQLSLNQQRLGTVLATLQAHGVQRVIDLGCGEGRLLGLLLRHREFSAVAGMDVALTALDRAAERLRLDRMPEAQRARLTLLHGSLVYADRRLSGYDAATVIEVIEHLEPDRLAAFERVLFESAAPKLLLVTTPNVEYNVRFPNLPSGKFRHPDHRFEWTRAEFRAWAEGLAARYGYAVALQPIGPLDQEVGAPTQLAVFERQEVAA